MKSVICPHFLCHLSSSVLIYRRRVSQLAPQVNLTSLACRAGVYVCVCVSIILTQLGQGH